MKKILITSTDLMMVQFLHPHVRDLYEHGFEVVIACSDVGGRLNEVKEKVGAYSKTIHVPRLRRNPLSPKNFLGYGDMKRVMAEEHFDLIWTNEPVMGVITRLCARKQRKRGAKVMYMAHGFHFFKGAPIVNWLVYYPIEKIMAKHTDMIITVNAEDYSRAKLFNVRDVRYIHGIGINTERLTLPETRGNIREELGIAEDSFVVLSVGELNKNKNQKTIIKAIAKLNDSSIHYVMCGKGPLHDRLVRLVKKYGLEGNIHFLGYRKDVVNICSQADVYVMPSFREGLPVSSLEAMFCGLPLLTSNIRGLVDVNKDGENGILQSPTDVDGFARAIRKFKGDPQLKLKMGERNRRDVIPYTLDNTKKEIQCIIKEILD